MGKIYKGQDWVTIKLNTYEDVSSATTAEILYTKPDGETGSWTATITDGSDGSLNTALSYDLAQGDLDQSGTWLFQAHVIVGGVDGYGETARLMVYALTN